MAEPAYTVFVRVPMPRGDFVDPPPVDWDSAKDDALWKILSDAAQREIDWNQVADRFDAPVEFLLQQVAYLTDRHASQVRAQVRKATAAAKGTSHSASSAAPSPIPGVSDSAVAPGLRTASGLSLRRDSPHLPAVQQRGDGSATGVPLSTSARPVASRNTSASTAVLREGEGSSSPRPGRPGSGTGADYTGRKRLSSLVQATPAAGKASETHSDERTRGQKQRSPSPGPAESSSGGSSDDDSSPAQSRIIRRPPRFHQQNAAASYAEGQDDDDDDSEPAFQPYQEPSEQSAAQDMTSTLRGVERTSSKRSTRTYRPHGKEAAHHSQTSDSSAGSAAMVKKPQKPVDQRVQGTLSPRQAAEATGRSPGGAARGYSREGSEGTPSMGSSFSDLDDASVTQSALEEQMASHMNRGAGSRFSISQALRSRYGPSSTQ